MKRIDLNKEPLLAHLLNDNSCPVWADGVSLPYQLETPLEFYEAFENEETDVWVKDIPCNREIIGAVCREHSLTLPKYGRTFYTFPNDADDDNVVRVLLTKREYLELVKVFGEGYVDSEAGYTLVDKLEKAGELETYEHFFTKVSPLVARNLIASKEIEVFGWLEHDDAEYLIEDVTDIRDGQIYFIEK